MAGIKQNRLSSIIFNLASLKEYLFFKSGSSVRYFTVADPDIELKERVRGGGGGFVSLALPAFLPSVISSFLPKIRGGDSRGLSQRSATLQDKPRLPSSHGPTSPSPPLPPNDSLPFPYTAASPAKLTTIHHKKRTAFPQYPSPWTETEKSYVKITAAFSNLGANVVRNIRGSCRRVRSNNHSCASIRFQVICLVKENRHYQLEQRGGERYSLV